MGVVAEARNKSSLAVHMTARKGVDSVIATLAVALASAPVARLVRGTLVVMVSEDLDDECAIAVQVSGAPPAPLQRCTTRAEVFAMLARGAVPGVRRRT
jgi:hypothetical protein